MKQSAGILLYKKIKEELFVLLVHPGGPLWQKKDLESWSIPKGEFTDEHPLEAALREWKEETGKPLKSSAFIELQPVRLKSGKIVYAWACEQDFDVTVLQSNTFDMEWPPKSGLQKSFPEVDRAEWFSLEKALQKINPAQRGFINELLLKI